MKRRLAHGELFERHEKVMKVLLKQNLGQAPPLICVETPLNLARAERRGKCFDRAKSQPVSGEILLAFELSSSPSLSPHRNVNKIVKKQLQAIQPLVLPFIGFICMNNEGFYPFTEPEAKEEKLNEEK
jgi:hypothetical protein